jgi:hypothetical protein
VEERRLVTGRHGAICLLALSLVLVSTLIATRGALAAGECQQRPAPRPLASSAPLPVGMTVIADEGLGSAAFRGLRPPSGASMSVHLYLGYEDPKLGVRVAAIRAYHAAGYRTLLTFNAHASGIVLTPQAYAGWIDHVLSELGSSLNAAEITNEANVPGSPTTSDGSNPLVIQDLVTGVQTAKRYSAAHHLGLQVGFNWVFDNHLNLNAFWTQLSTSSACTPTRTSDRRPPR